MIARHVCFGTPELKRDEKGKVINAGVVLTVWPDESYCPYCKQKVNGEWRPRDYQER